MREEGVYQSFEKLTISVSKIIQVNNTVVYVIGGNQYPSLLGRKYDVPKSCMKIDMATGEIVKLADMRECRSSFGLCVLRNIIYVFGGRHGKNYNEEVEGCEKYNILTDRWEDFVKVPDNYTIGMSVSLVEKRFVYGFAGVNARRETEYETKMRIVRIDL